jgi:hypothetical protein
MEDRNYETPLTIKAGATPVVRDTDTEYAFER